VNGPTAMVHPIPRTFCLGSWAMLGGSRSHPTPMRRRASSVTRQHRASVLATQSYLPKVPEPMPENRPQGRPCACVLEERRGRALTPR